MVIDPTLKTALNETFTMDIKVTITGGEEVDTAGAHLDFDTTYLGALSITPGTALSDVKLDALIENKVTLEALCVSCGGLSF